jgi:hypothetical protein
VLRTLALCCACLAAAPRAATAEWHFTPMVGLTFKGNTSIVDLEGASGKVHKHVGGAVSRLGDGVLGVEGIAIFTPGFFQSGELINEVNLVGHSRSLALMGNAVLTVPRRWTEYSLRPFVSGGLGLMHASESDVSGVFSVRSNLPAFNIGGGAVGFFTARTGMRLDLRYSSSLQRIDQGAVSTGRVHLSYMTASVGIVLRR